MKQMGVDMGLHTKEGNAWSDVEARAWVKDYAKKFDELTGHDSSMKSRLMSDDESVKESAVQDLVIKLQSDEESEES